MKNFIAFTLLLALLGTMISETSAQRGGCMCPAVYQPVCGANGVTYSNSCRASCSGVKVKYNGSCGGGASAVPEPVNVKKKIAR